VGKVDVGNLIQVKRGWTIKTLKKKPTPTSRNPRTDAEKGKEQKQLRRGSDKRQTLPLNQFPEKQRSDIRYFQVHGGGGRKVTRCVVDHLLGGRGKKSCGL